MKRFSPNKLDVQNLYLRDYLTSRFGDYINLEESICLEVGIGRGRMGFLLAAEFNRYFGIDNIKINVRDAVESIPEGAKAAYSVGEAERIPFGLVADLVFYSYSWNFITDFDKALQEANRILKPGGIIAILEPMEDIRNWAYPQMNPESQKFNKVMYDKKIEKIRRAEEALHRQNSFRIFEENRDKNGAFSFFVLGRYRN